MARLKDSDEVEQFLKVLCIEKEYTSKEIFRLREIVKRQSILIGQLETQLWKAHSRDSEVEVQQLLEAMYSEIEYMTTENLLLRKAVKELEMKVDIQKRTVAARDESIKNLMEKTRVDGKISEEERLEMEKLRNKLIETETRCKHFENMLDDSMDRNMTKEELRIERHRRYREIMEMSAKMKTLEKRQSDYQRHIAELQEYLCAKGQHYYCQDDGNDRHMKVKDGILKPSSRTSTRRYREVHDTNPFSRAINHFCFTFYKHLVKDQGNIFFSPFSICSILSVLMSGARGYTEQEIREVLRFNEVNIPSSEVQLSFDRLLPVFNIVTDHMTLTSANAILLQKDVPILTEFKETAEKTHDVWIMEADFVREGEKAVGQVNDFMKRSTNGNIPSIIQCFGSSTVMLLLNAVYFKGSWDQPFNPELTRPKTFYNKGRASELKQVPMMFKNNYFYFIEKETYKALELPYKSDGIVMVLLLPKDIDGLGHLEKTLTIDLLKDIMHSLGYSEVEVSLPKLDIEYAKVLSESLAELGMVSVFQPSADFRGVNANPNDSIFVTDVATKSRLVVDEEGAEDLTLATPAKGTSRYLKQKKNTFEADHPFLYVIYDLKSDMILFIGRVFQF